MNKQLFFSKVERYKDPSTILFRSIELGLLKKKLSKALKCNVVLDLGCGDGIAGSLIFDKKIDYGLDNNKYFVNLAKKGKVYKKVIYADAKKIPLKNNCVDLVFSNCVIEHIQDLDAVLKEATRILKKEGYFIFTAPSNNFKKYGLFSRLKLNWLAKIYGRARDRKLNHYNCHSIKKWTQILKKRGFKVIDKYYYIDKEAAEFWDFLLILFFVLKINKSLSAFVYKRFAREKICNHFLNSKAAGSYAAAICIIAKKK
ncbi:class I SAM-dependent methyltransferase [Candidatus Microgenomates bacterium]|nr:class I SAM-dependent methyltransferase [Candidatus Microgenomates bacterium]